MQRTTDQIPSLSLPPDDGTIGRALADVETRLAAWAAAMTTAQSSLVSLAQREPVPPAVNPAHPEADRPEEQSAAAETETGNPAQPQRAPTSAEGFVPPLGDEQNGEPANPEPGTDLMVSAPGPAVLDTTPVAQEPEPAVVAAIEDVTAEASANAAETPVEDDDEALLASLDEETAKAIRVMRRLTFEKKKVRELLEEYRQTQAKPTPGEGRKKSWWTRGSR
ncbi:MAG: hypothetical protein AMXMBFR13_18570 [Phycisphaerae bacterium]